MGETVFDEKKRNSNKLNYFLVARVLENEQFINYVVDM